MEQARKQKADDEEAAGKRSSTPLRDAAGENVGLLVLAYKNDGANARTDEQFYAMSMQLRQEIQKEIPSFAALFAPAT
jgi:hypothetical protein